MNTIKELISNINEFFNINEEVFKNNMIPYGTILFLIILTIIMI